MPGFRFASLGDSLTQGFMSGAVSRTELSYPALIARTLGLTVPASFRVPRFPCSGLPINIEDFLREVGDATGPDISAAEWIFRFPRLLYDFADRVEDCYERGRGSRPAAFRGVYHNLAVWGFTVNEALTLTPALCDEVIADREGFIEDDFLGIPSAPMYRTAKRVLNPGDAADRRGDGQLDALARLVAQEGPLDALTLWYGANDALGTVLELEVRDMAEAEGEIPTDPIARRRWNLTSAEQFRRDYARLAARVDDVVGTETAVFVGNVPHVTIPPITTGIPPLRGRYFERYSRFFVDGGSFRPLLHSHLTRGEAMRIDRRIDAFNEIIRREVDARANWHLVDPAGALDRLAVKRNRYSDPAAALRDFYAHRPDHPLLELEPIPSLLMLRTDEGGRRLGGGLTSLDGVHPATIGYGIVAELFLEAMQAAGIEGADPLDLDWHYVIAHDSLLRAPPIVWDDVLQTARENATLWELVAKIIF